MRSGPTKSKPGDGWLELGHVAGAFGVRGELRLVLHHRDGEVWRRPRAVRLVGPDGARRAVTLDVRGGSGKRWIGRVDGIADRDAAEALAGWVIEVDPTTLPRPGVGEFYVWQVEGLPVTIDGAVVGSVRDVHATAGGDVLEVETPSGVAFVACVRAFVLRIDPEAGVVALAPGALDEGEA